MGIFVVNNANPRPLNTTYENKKNKNTRWTDVICVYVSGKWPEGSYALPRSSYDCPVNKWFDWFTASVVLEWENPQQPSQWTPGIHILGLYGDNVLSLMTCAKLDDVVSSDVIAADTLWPEGSYCIYQVAEECPPGKNCRCCFMLLCY